VIGPLNWAEWHWAGIKLYVNYLPYEKNMVNQQAYKQSSTNGNAFEEATGRYPGIGWPFRTTWPYSSCLELALPYYQ
jgi:hypothetical protein